MFDLFQSLEAPGEVEMVSLVPDFDEELEVEEAPQVEVEEPAVEEVPQVKVEEPEVEKTPAVEEIIQIQVEKPDSEKVAMSRTYVVNQEKIEIAYINYNKVRITRGNQTPILKEFASSKEAVDYYVEQMQEYEIDE